MEKCNKPEIRNRGRGLIHSRHKGQHWGAHLGKHQQRSKAVEARMQF